MHLNLNDIINDYLEKNADVFGNESVEKLRKKIKNNERVPDDLVIESLVISLKRYEQFKSVKTIIISGFPMNIQQAKNAEKYVSIVKKFQK